MLFKNPLFLSFLMTAIVFVLLFLYYNKKTVNKKNNKIVKNKFDEKMFIGAIVAGVITWIITSNYFIIDTKKILDISASPVNHQINTDSNISLDVIESGINIPKNDIKLPNVLIDYN